VRPPPCPRGSLQIAMLAEYFPVLLFILVGLGFGVLLVGLGWTASTVLGVNRPDSEKLSPYECGFEAFEDARMKFDVRYYLVAILFIIFDLEIAYFIPWALALDHLGVFGLLAMIVFVLELVIGFFFVWKKGALEWE
jgi:NADH-quinone oxidoreductase subunit A